MDKLQVEVPGYSQQAPKIEGWRVFWVARYGHERTVYVYRRAEA